MAEWKDRGYVPDSDDEEDSIPCTHLNGLIDTGPIDNGPHLQPRDGEGSCLEKPGIPPNQRPASSRLPSSSPRPATNHFEIVVSPTASKLQAELHRGLQACKDVLATAPDLAAYLEEDDSPLSSLASSPSLGPVPLVEDSAPRPPTSPQRQQPAEPPSVAVINSSPPRLRLEDVPEASYLSAGPVRRSLRPRTLLQLNPYSLEYARYQQECSRRGIVPVRMANFAAERAKANGKDTQLSDPFQESDFASSPTRSPVSAIGIRGDGTDGSLPLAGSPRDIWSTLGDDDELPDLSDILSHHPVGKFRWQHADTPHAVKPVVADKADDEPTFKQFKLPWEISTSRQDQGSARHLSVFDHPLSPAPSETVASDQPPVHSGDDLPALQITPVPLPTPAVSSDRAHSKRKLVVLSDSSQEETSPDDPESQSSESENDDSQGLLQIRRRIRGVLPASWLKLEAKQRPQKTPTQPHNASENIVPPIKGVAKHISLSRPRDTPRSSAHKPIIFSSDAEDDAASENDRENDERPRTSPNPLTEEGAWESDVEMEAFAVEDEIDRMLPSVRRTMNPRRPKTQRILGDSWSNLTVPRPPQKQSSITKPRASIRKVATRPAIKRRKTKHRAHQLTVFDAPGFTLNGTRPPPQYLRIAARKRPSRRAALPQNVAHKFVRLPDLREAVDAAATRYEGHVRRPSRTYLPRQQRSSIDLTEGVAHDERYQQDHADTEDAESLDNLKQSTAAIVSRLRAGALRRLYPQTPIRGTRPPAHGQNLSCLRAPDLNRSPRFRSAVPNWLEHVHASQQSSSSNATNVKLIRPRRPASNTSIITTTVQPHTPRSHRKPQRIRKQKPGPQNSAVENQTAETDYVPLLPPDISDSALVGDHDNEQDEEAFVVWVLDHLTLDSTMAAKLVPPSITTDAPPLETDLDGMIARFFSRAQLPETFLQFQSLADPQHPHPPEKYRTGEAHDSLNTIFQTINSLGRKRVENAFAAFIVSTYTGPLSQLAATLLILSMICPLSGANSGPDQCSNNSHKDTFDGWQVLQPSLSRFLAFYTTSNSQSQSPGLRLGLLAVQFCYLAIREWQWTSSDAIVKFWFKQYAQNDMIELFVVPDVGRVTERSKRAALGLETEHSDTDYDIFLKSVAALFETRAQSMAFYGDDVGRAAGRIQSLIFSISPNNSRKLSDDQSLHLEDLVSMANIYALYEYLNEFAPPGCQPRFALVEKLIDFPNCHWSVSQFALRTWSRFAHNAITRGDISMLSTLGSWIKRMTEQMAMKLSPIPSDHYEPRPTSEEYALQRNATRTRQQISELLSSWKSALARCPTDDECKALLNGGAIGPIVDFCKDRRLCTVDVVTNICELVHKYLDRADTEPSNLVRATLHRQFRQIMIATLSSDNHGPTECLKPLTCLWYHFARITVKNKQKTWDDYLSLPSSWSFGLLAASDSSRQCKVLFLKMILEHDMMYFELDHEPFYSAWIQGIVQPQCNLLFEHELTKSIILHETDEMSFQDLQSMLRGAQGQLRLEMADFIQNQFEIVKHVIRSIFLLQFDDEDSQDYLGKPLNIDQGRRLLRLITDTIKACWRALPAASRGPYAEFARSVVTQLRIYKYKDFDIDPWFIDPQQPEFPKDVPFANQFLLPINQPRPELDDRLIRIFTAGNLQAAGTGHECSWSEDIVRALSATSATTAVDTKGKLALNSDLQFAFMREVMSVYVYSMFQGPGHALFTRPVLAGILAIVRNWHFRLDINSDSVLCHMLFTAVDLLASIFEALTTVRARLASFLGHGSDIGALINVLIDLSSACVRRVTMLEASVEKSQENLDAVEKGFACANLVYETLLPFSPGRHHTAVITAGNGSVNDPDISIEMVRLEKTTLMSKTQTILEESLRGRNGQFWRIDHPLANSWEAWMVNSNEAAGDFSIALMNLRHALMDADMLLVEDGNDWAEDDQAEVLL